MYRIITEDELKRKLTSSTDSIEINRPIRQYFMPKIVCPWPLKRNPYFEANESNESNEYLLQNSNVIDEKVREHLNKVRVGEWSVLAYPFAEKYKVVNLVNFIHFITLIDDHEECDWGEAFGQIKFWTDFSNVIVSKDGEDLSSMPKYFLECKLIVDKICEDLSETQKQIFIETLDNWGLVNKYKENTNKDLKVLDFESQLENRVFNVGMVFCAFLVEYEMNIELSDFERSHPLMIEYCGEIMKHQAYSNDLYSFRKEYIHANGDLSLLSNTIATLVRYHKLDINSAILLMKGKIEECNDSCVRIKREIQATTELNSSSVETYLFGAEYMMSGNHEFHKTSPRYHGTHRDISNTLITISLNN